MDLKYSMRSNAVARPHLFSPAAIANLCVLLAIVIAIPTCNYFVDPFNLHPETNLNLNRQSVSQRMDYFHWKTPEFARAPSPVILLGDSRMNRISAERASSFLGHEVYNFAFGGGNLADSLSTYWYAREQTHLDAVYLGVTFQLLNDGNAYDRAYLTQQLLNDPVRYYYSPFISRVSSRVVAFTLFGIGAVDEQPPMDKEAFWNYQIDVIAHRYFSRYSYPHALLTRLREVALDCRANNTELTIVYFPVHIDLLAQIDQYGLREAYNKSKRELSKIATLIDFNNLSPLTQDPENFSDPFHFTYDVAIQLEKSIFSRPTNKHRLLEVSEVETK